MQLPAPLSFLSNGLELYYYANVNFDTEFKKRLLDFFFSKKKKKVPYVWSSLLLYFVTWIVNYAFCKRGEEGEGSSFASLFYGFCVHGIPMSWPGRGVRAGGSRPAQWAGQRRLGPPISCCGWQAWWPANPGHLQFLSTSVAQGSPSQPSSVNPVQQWSPKAPALSG